jgi:hypothetical protein
VGNFRQGTNALFKTASLSGPGNWADTIGGSMQVQASSALNQQAFAGIDNTGDRYFSLLFRNDTAGASWTGARLLFEAFGSSNEGYGVNIDYNHLTSNLSIYARTGNANTGAVTIATGTTILIIGKYVDNGTGGGTTTIWINPTDFTSEATVASTAFGTTSTVNATVARDDGIAFRSVGTAFTVDALRLGTTFADVIAVPEPASFAALAGLGALGFAAARRRRRA